MENNIAAIDFETYYDEEYSLTTLGSYNYVFDPHFDAYMVSVVTPAWEWCGHPRDFEWGYIRGWEWVHHNASFDELVLHKLRLAGLVPQSAVPSVTHCTADLAAYLGSPRSLAGASSFLMGEPKMDKTVRDKMKGRKVSDLSPAEETELRDYALKDSRNCLALWKAFSDQWPEVERELSRHSRMIGWEGVPIDLGALREALPDLKRQSWDAMESLPWTKGGSPPLSPKALAAECRSVGILPPASLAEDSPSCAAWEEEHGELFPWVAAMRTFRRTNTLLKKMESMYKRSRAVEDESYFVMSAPLLYFGASTTGRWSGSGGVNLQNLPASEMFGVNLRGFIKAPPGYKLVNADSSQIEPRCLAWLVGDEAMLSEVRGGMSVYEAHARATMGWTGGKLKDEDPDLYKLAKARVLSLGYGAGAEKFQVMAKNYGLELSAKVADKTVDDYRRSNPLICGRAGLWNTLQKGMERSAAKREDFHIELPTGRLMRYEKPSTAGGLTAVTTVSSSRSRRKWWGGSLTENLVQATAREVFSRMILKIESAGHPVLFHVHDEVTVLAKEDEADKALADVLRIMSEEPAFMPGLPLGAEGKICDSYPLK